MGYAFLAKVDIEAGAYLVAALFWLVPVGGYFAFRAYQRHVPRKFIPLQELLTIEDRTEFINEMGELVQRESPTPRYLRSVLPSRDLPLTDANCYTYWHDQFLYQQRAKYDNPMTKVFDIVNNIFTSLFAFGFIVVLPIMAGEYWWVMLLFISLPFLGITTDAALLMYAYNRYKKERFKLYLQLDDKFSGLLERTQAC